VCVCWRLCVVALLGSTRLRQTKVGLTYVYVCVCIDKYTYIYIHVYGNTPPIDRIVMREIVNELPDIEAVSRRSAHGTPTVDNLVMGEFVNELP